MHDDDTTELAKLRQQLFDVDPDTATAEAADDTPHPNRVSREGDNPNPAPPRDALGQLASELFGQ